MADINLSTCFIGFVYSFGFLFTQIKNVLYPQNRLTLTLWILLLHIMGLDFSLLKHICLKNHLDMRTEKSLSTTSWNSLLRDLSEGVWSMDSDPEVAPLSSPISSTRALRSLSRAALSRGWLPSKSVDSISRTCMNGILRTPPTCK